MWGDDFHKNFQILEEKNSFCFISFNFLMLLLLRKPYKGSRNIQGFALIRAVLLTMNFKQKQICSFLLSSGDSSSFPFAFSFLSFDDSSLFSFVLPFLSFSFSFDLSLSLSFAPFSFSSSEISSFRLSSSSSISDWTSSTSSSAFESFFFPSFFLSLSLLFLPEKPLPSTGRSFFQKIRSLIWS